METIVAMKNFSYCDLFQNLNITIPQGKFVALMGSNNCGKTVFLKLLAGLLEGEGELAIGEVTYSSKTKKEIQKKIGFVFENPDFNFIGETPYEDLTFLLRNRGYKEKEIKTRIQELCHLLPIESLLDCSISNLSGGEKQILAFATALAPNHDLLLLDDPFSMLDGVLKEKMLKLLKKINKEQKTTIIYVTHDSDDALYANHIMLLGNNEILLEGKKEQVFKEEKLFKKAGVELPFMASLSLKLQFYGLIDKMILDMDKMVNVLWK